MNIGLRPRIRARPSFYDLIRNRSIESLSLHRQHSFSQELLAELPPLPPSPSVGRSPLSQRTEFIPQSQEEEEEEALEMAPKKAPVKDEDGEDQYGRSPQEEQVLNTS